jgi:hypothetical protein
MWSVECSGCGQHPVSCHHPCGSVNSHSRAHTRVRAVTQVALRSPSPTPAQNNAKPSATTWPPRLTQRGSVPCDARRHLSKMTARPAQPSDLSCVFVCFVCCAGAAVTLLLPSPRPHSLQLHCNSKVSGCCCVRRVNHSLASVPHKH